jgi:hypothetical protein
MRLLLQILTLLVFTFSVQSCATFQKSTVNQQKLTENHLKRINGLYKIRAESDSFTVNSDVIYHNAFEKFYRGKGRSSKDTTHIVDLDNYSFEIRLLGNKQIEITYLKDKVSFRKYTLKYKLKDDGYVYLKNKNFKMIGIPYLIGGIDIKKLRLTSIDNYLLIEEVYHSSGATLLIFGDSKTWNYINRYERIE